MPLKSKITRWIYKLYVSFFVKKEFYRFHVSLYHLSLFGLGVLNSESFRSSGEEWFFKNFVKTGQNQIIFDIGANEGEYSIRIRRISNTPIIYSFEPHPRTFSRLQQKAKECGFLAFNYGCSNQKGEGVLFDYFDQDGSGNASLYKDVFPSFHQSKSVTQHTIKLVTIDDFAQEHGISRIDILKIDVEGHELDVLKGAMSLLNNKKISVIHFEFNHMNIISRVYFKDFFDLLVDFDLYRMLPNGLAPIREYSSALCEIFAYQNIVAILKE